MDFLAQRLKFAVFAVARLKETFNTDEKVSVKDTLICNAKQVANPYSDEVKGTCSGACPHTSEAEERSEEGAPEELVENSRRVATRARLTYEMYRYNKNAMLIMSSGSDGSVWMPPIDDLTRTFQGYRFEVEICQFSDVSDLYSKCEQFFQRDFTDYGAVGIVVLTLMESTEQLNCPYKYMSLSTIAENFKLDRNPTLAMKPKIYITESDGRIGRPSKLLLDRETYGDVIGFHVPLTLPHLNKLTSNRPDNPMNVLCKNLAAMAEENNFSQIIEETVRASVLDYPLLGLVVTRIIVINTLSKELYLARSAENQ